MPLLRNIQISIDWTRLFLCLPPAAPLCCSVYCLLNSRCSGNIIPASSLWKRVSVVLVIGPLLKACLFVIGWCKQSSLPPVLHTDFFSLRPLSSPLWCFRRDGIMKPVESNRIRMKYLFDTALSIRTDSQLKSQNTTHVSVLLREWGLEGRPVI